MRIATWNVNSLKARLPRVEEWLEYARPDVLCLQETKLADKAFPALAFSALGYESVHHGYNQWNGVAILSRVGIEDPSNGFGEGVVDPYADDARHARGHVRRDPRRQRLRPERPRGAERVLRPQARLVGAARRVGRRRVHARGPARDHGGLQRRARGPRRLVARRRSRAPRTSPSPSGPRSGGSRSGASSTRSGASTTRTGSTATGTTAVATSTRAAACGSTSCSRRRRWPIGSPGPSSTATPARASSPRTTRRCWWISPTEPDAGRRPGDGSLIRRRRGSSLTRHDCTRNSGRSPKGKRSPAVVARDRDRRRRSCSQAARSSSTSSRRARTSPTSRA